MSKKPRVLVLTGYGINCDEETAYAWRRAGAAPRRVHLNELIAKPSLLREYEIMTLPGGFSYGDHIASGRVLAMKIRTTIMDDLREFVSRGKLVLGICNGFQILIKAGILPAVDGDSTRQTASLVHNDSGRFEDRWVTLRRSAKTPCVFLEGIEHLQLPVRHGEGKFVTVSRAVLTRIRRHGGAALRYEGDRYPDNPNGSVDNIAGVCDPTGRVFGLMPHPEAYLLPQQAAGRGYDGPTGLALFENAVQYLR
jgi:phosphoribosylformylglycinamidine synthase subunit PurQ / glutaminase